MLTSWHPPTFVSRRENIGRMIYHGVDQATGPGPSSPSTQSWAVYYIHFFSKMGRPVSSGRLPGSQPGNSSFLCPALTTTRTILSPARVRTAPGDNINAVQGKLPQGLIPDNQTSPLCHVVVPHRVPCILPKSSRTVPITGTIAPVPWFSPILKIYLLQGLPAATGSYRNSRPPFNRRQQAGIRQARHRHGAPPSPCPCR